MIYLFDDLIQILRQRLISIINIMGERSVAHPELRALFDVPL